MANVLLTESCIRSCPYCFAKKHMAGAENVQLSWDDLIYIADLHEVSGQKAIALLGGEPTLHTEFTDIVLYLLERGFHVNVFTSGVLSEKTFEDCGRHLSGIHPDKLSFVCNVNEPKFSSFSELDNVKRFLNVFSHLTAPGFNIYRLDFNLNFIFKYISEYGLKKHIRLGLAHPIPGTKNKYIKVDKFDQFANRLMSFYPMLNRLRIQIGFDCGFPMCVFSEEQLGKLFKLNVGNLRFTCGPAIDIGPNMEVWSCFPLSNYHKKSIYDFNSIQDIGRYFEDRHKMIRTESSGIYEACDECRHREEGVCHGGCLAHMLSAFYKEPKIRVEEVYYE